MSEIIDAAVAALGERMSGGFGGRAKFVIEGEGAVMIDGSGVRPGDDEADVTLTADVDTFRGILEGEVNPTSAYMTGRLRVDGDMGLALQLGSLLA